jgi:hypothetical protein
MGVTIALPLFAGAGQELEEGAAAEGRQLRELATDLQGRLLRAADTLDRLRAAGWECRVALYDVLLSCPGVETQDQAVARLGAAGVNPEELLIVEDLGEDEGEELA